MQLGREMGSVFYVVGNTCSLYSKHYTVPITRWKPSPCQHNITSYLVRECGSNCYGAINVHGQLGKNIPCDLHMEHLNRESKSSIGGLGANITDNAIQRVGKSLRSSTAILEMFDQVNNCQSQSGHHTTRVSDCDISKLLKQIHTESNMFAAVQGRQHRNYPNFRSNMIKNLTSLSGFMIVTTNSFLIANMYSMPHEHH